jgi:WD40 repeat protein
VEPDRRRAQIKNAQHFILVVTPAALAESKVIQREIRLARQQGKTACPVKGPDLGDLGKLPRWIGQIYDLDLVEHQTTLIRVLEADSRQKRVPMMAPEPPPDFVPRPKEFDTLKQQLLDAKGDAVAGITAALRGAGGYGKTTLAEALAHDPDIQDAYFDGILWVVLGEKPERLLSILTDQIELLTGERPGLETIHAAAGKLGEAMGDRRILLIVDDAWREQDLRPFLQGGPNCVRLVTTRIDKVLPNKAVRQRVDAMQADEALQLLGSGLPPDQISRGRRSLERLAARLGEWALLLKIVNSFLRDRIANARQSVSRTIIDVNRRLDAKNLIAFDARDATERNQAVARTIGVSLELLSNVERLRFGDLAVFSEDAEVPIVVAKRLWAERGLKDLEAEDLLSRLSELSLLYDFDLQRRVFRLHDTIRHFLRVQAGEIHLIAQHRELVAALDELQNMTPDVVTRRYYYVYFLHHLAEAQERNRLDALLLDPSWLKTKLEATANPQDLVSDYQHYGVGEAQSLICRTLQLIGGICARDPRQLLPQLMGRLEGFEVLATSNFLSEARRLAPRPAIIPWRPSLSRPGAETARLEGHTDSVRALCKLGDGRLASGSSDTAILLWDVTTGVDDARLEGHIGRINALCLLKDGRLASATSDNTIRLWDPTDGAEVGCLEGHTDAVNALCLLQDGRLASGSSDNTIRTWDVTTGKEIARLKGHTGSILALCLLSDGRLASGSEDKTIRLWDPSRAEIARLEGHTVYTATLCYLLDGRLASGSWDDTIRLWDVEKGVENSCLTVPDAIVPALCSALCVLPDGRLAAGSYDDTIRLWDLIGESEPARIQGHTDSVHALCLLSDGRLASGSSDRTVRLWDVRSGVEAAGIEWQTPYVNTLCMLPDGRLASGSSDRTIRLWDVRTGIESTGLAGHTDDITALCLLPDGRLVSGSRDSTIRVWDTTAATETVRLEGHSDTVDALCALSDGRLASASLDRTIRLWDMATGTETSRLKGHNSYVAALCQLPHGRLASGSYDKTIRLWDLATGSEVGCLEGHTDRVSALCLLRDGRLASGCWDKTIRLWDLSAGAETACIDGHTGKVNALCLLHNGRFASGSSDKTIRVWGVALGSQSICLEVDTPVQALAAIAPTLIVAGDHAGLHWLEVVD